MGLVDAVELAVNGRVPVGVALEVEAGEEVHGLSGFEEAAVGVDGHHLAVLEVLGPGQHVHEGAARGPGELVAQGVVGGLGGGETAAERDEAFDFAAGGVDLVEALHGQQVVDAGVDAHLVDDGDAGVDGLVVEGPHGVGAVGGRHQVGLLRDAPLGDVGVERPRQQRHHDLVRLDHVVQRLRTLVHVQQDRLRSLELGGQGVGLLLERRRHRHAQAGVPGQVVNDGSRDVAGAEHQDLQHRHPHFIFFFFLLLTRVAFSRIFFK